MPPLPPPAPSAAPAPQPVGRLDQQRWRRRLLVAIAPRVSDDRLRYQVDEVRRLTSRADTRDLLLVTVEGDRVEGVADGAAELRTRFHVGPLGYRSLLIGKDGHAALTSSAPLPAEEIARAIDAMPMRRDEMKRRR